MKVVSIVGNAHQRKATLEVSDIKLAQTLRALRPYIDGTKFEITVLSSSFLITFEESRGFDYREVLANVS